MIKITLILVIGFNMGWFSQFAYKRAAIAIHNPVTDCITILDTSNAPRMAITSIRCK